MRDSRNQCCQQVIGIIRTHKQQQGVQGCHATIEQDSRKRITFESTHDGSKTSLRSSVFFRVDRPESTLFTSANSRVKASGSYTPMTFD